MPDIKTVYDYYLSCSDHTAKDRDKYAYNRLSVFFIQPDLRDIKRTDLRQYVQHRRSLKIADSTINRELRSLRAALNFWLTDHNDPSLNPLARFSLIEPDNIEAYLTRSEARHLLNHCAHNPALFWYVRLLLATGCRSGQILKMTWSQVDFNRRLFLFASTATKSRKRLVLPMSPSAEACL
ncbi:MAG: site-specific integrase, partial [Pseudomonadota bacterium]|nr:site-specific integrase [Pseudomonadota bacterium]